MGIHHIVKSIRHQHICVEHTTVVSITPYEEDIAPLYSVIRDKTVLEIAVGHHCRLIHMYNSNHIRSYVGIEPFEPWYDSSGQVLESFAQFPYQIHNCDYESYTAQTPDVVVCNGLAYHLHSPFHLFEYLANTNAEYIILETTQTPGDNPTWSGANTTHNTMSRIKEEMESSNQSFDDYIMKKSRNSILSHEHINKPGNSISTQRAIPWRVVGMNPDIKVLAFWCMGYDLDASLERVNGGYSNKSSVTVYRFKRVSGNRDPRNL